MNSLDLVRALDLLLPAAQYRRASSYTELLQSWADPRPIPTLAELEAAWAAIQQADNLVLSRRQQLTALRRSYPDPLDLRAFDSTTLLGRLAARLAWLEAELRDLRGSDSSSSTAPE